MVVGLREEYLCLLTTFSFASCRQMLLLVPDGCVSAFAAAVLIAVGSP